MIKISRILFLLTVFLVLQNQAFAQVGRLLREGNGLFEAGIYEAALSSYLKADRQTNIQNPDVLYKIAYCQAYINNADEAQAYMSKLFENTKDTTEEYYYVLARIAHLKHRFENAMKFYKKSDPRNANKREIAKKLKECEYGKKYISNPVKVKITNMGERINSPEHDLLPKITADQQWMYFTSHRAGFIGGRNPEDIFASHNKGGAWEPPFRVKSLSTEENEASVGLSHDGQKMYVFKGSNGGDIFQTILEGDEWTKPEPMPFNTPYKETSAAISPDGRTLLFVRKVREGSSDVYVVSENFNGNWSAPRKLGSYINTIYDEESPYFHADGKTIYFSSKGHSSMGGYDIFKVERKGNGWSEPENLGYPINTAGDELAFVMSAKGTYGYYSTTREGGYGRQDLYTIRFPLSEKPKLALLKGKITEEFSGKPVSADITITDNEKNEVVANFKSNEKTGEYLVSLPSGKNYGITIEKKGHLFHSENVYLDEKQEYKEVKKDIKMVNIKPGSKVVLSNIFFDSGSHELKSTSYGELQKLVELLKRESSIRVEISGHTDNIGSDALNKTLSKKRAMAVVDFLSKNGISLSRMQAKGYGSEQPVAPNSTEAGRQLNRRTELKIIE